MAKYLVCYAGGKSGKREFDNFAEAVVFYTNMCYECNCATFCDLETKSIIAQEADNGDGVAVALNPNKTKE